MAHINGFLRMGRWGHCTGAYSSGCANPVSLAVDWQMPLIVKSLPGPLNILHVLITVVRATCPTDR